MQYLNRRAVVGNKNDGLFKGNIQVLHIRYKRTVVTLGFIYMGISTDIIKSQGSYRY
jgi:hypothetical protein